MCTPAGWRFSGHYQCVSAPSFGSCVPQIPYHHACVEKKSAVTCLKGSRPVAPTPIITKCFERIVLSHIKVLLLCTDIRLPTGRTNQQRMSHFLALHMAQAHLEQPHSYVRMLFVGFSLAFNTVIPDKLTQKLHNLGLFGLGLLG